MASKRIVVEPQKCSGNTTANKNAFDLLIKATTANLAKQKIATPAWLKKPDRWYLRSWHDQVLTHEQVLKVRMFNAVTRLSAAKSLHNGEAFDDDAKRLGRGGLQLMALVYTYQTGGQYIKATMKALATMPAAERGRKPAAIVAPAKVRKAPAKQASPAKAKAPIMAQAPAVKVPASVNTQGEVLPTFQGVKVSIS